LETYEDFEDRLPELADVWHDIRNADKKKYENVPDFHDWFLQYQAEPLGNHLIAAVRIQVDYVTRDGTARLFYNNDNEAINHVFKNETNWELRPLSDMIDLLGRCITAQKNETIRAMYDGGELELVAPYTRFVHDSRVWSRKAAEERQSVISSYYSYKPPVSQTTTLFNISSRAGRT
ncbi:unnamed protein product, partial [Didymodactylos carnosus]